MSKTPPKTSSKNFQEKLTSFLARKVPADELQRNLGIKIQPGQQLSYEDIIVQNLVSKACGGDDKAMRELLDRYLGKPKQVSENLNLEMTYNDYLETLLAEDEAEAKELPDPGKVVDVEVDVLDDLLS